MTATSCHVGLGVSRHVTATVSLSVLFCGHTTLPASQVGQHSARCIRDHFSQAGVHVGLPGRQELLCPHHVPVRAYSNHRQREARVPWWAKISRGEAEPPAPDIVVAPKAKRRISKEGMARIIAATKKRWAAVKAVQAKSAATKNAALARKKVAVKKASNKSASVENDQ
jgi:hypothetical protein